MDSFEEARRQRYDKRQILRRLGRSPKKHYVRKFGWLPIAQSRCQRIGRPVRYFTLPGEEGLDILHLYRNGLIQRTSRGFPEVGICELHAEILAEVLQKMKFVGRQKTGRFEDVAKESDFPEWFYYDVVNLDFTGVPFPVGEESPFEGTWGAIEKVIESQAKNKQPFDLFLTFNGDTRGTNQNALRELLENLNRNLDSQLRKDALKNRVGYLDTRRLLKEDYPEFLLVALPKLIVGLAVSCGFECPVIKTFYYQRTGHEGPYKILKFAFSLECPQRRKKSLRQQPQSVETYEQGVLLSFSTVPTDVDAKLAANPGLRKGLESELQNLSWSP